MRYCRLIRLPRTPVWASLLAMVGIVSGMSSARAADPLHTRIDQLVEADGVGGLAPVANDAEFVRRVYLDLTGRLPTAAEARALLDDPSPTKRESLVDRLLASPQWAQFMAARFDVMLMERRTEATIPPAEWRKYLVASFAANKPWDQLAREILSADGADPNLRPAAKFYLDRGGEPNLLTRDVARTFFGMDLQCAQCHDHPLIDDYVQSDYYGIFAFLNRSYVFTDKKDAKQVFFAEKADGEAKFASVFTKQAGQSGPRIPDGEYLVETVLKKGEEYVVAPADNVRPVPKYSRRAELAKQATNGANRAFNRNIANRIWALMMGRGLVEPVDLHHTGNPPAHPQLLDLLTDEIVALKFDIRALMREVALSRTYQRALDLPPDFTAPAQVAATQLASLETEQKRLEAVSDELRKNWEKAAREVDAAEKTLLPLLDELEKAQGAAGKAFEASSKAAAALATAQQQLAAKQDVAGVLAAAAAKTMEAAKKLPDDKELAAAAEKFQARSQTVAGEVAAATKAANDLMPPAKAAADALAAAEQTVQQAADKLTAARPPVDALRKQAVALDAQYHSALYVSEQATARFNDAKTLAQLQTLAAAADASRAALAKTQADVAANKQTLERLAAEVPKRQAEMAEVQKARDESVRLLTEAQQQFAAKQDLAKTLVDAATQAEAAKQKLPNDAELAAAAAQFKTRGDKATAEVAEVQKLVAAREPAAKTATEKLAAAQQALATMTAEMAAAQQRVATLDAAAKQAGEKIAADDMALANARQEWAQRWSNRFYAAGLRHLTPEQLAWSIMQVSGVVAQQRAAADAELSKTVPLSDAIKADPAQLAARDRQLEQLVQDKLAGNVAAFVNLFGGAPGQNQTDFFATVDQALFFANGGTLLGWLAPSGDNLTGRLVKLEGPALADELYLSVLTRKPTPQEVNDVTQYVAARANEKPVAVQELAWALITSSEFRFNH